MMANLQEKKFNGSFLVCFQDTFSDVFGLYAVKVLVFVSMSLTQPLAGLRSQCLFKV